MKKLTLLNDDTNIKLGDTGTLIQFKASINDAPVFLKEGQTATFRIKNDLGFLKSIDADTNMNGYVFEFDTSELVDLPVGSYQVELAITKSEDNVIIFPDKGFVNFDITENALSVTGEQLPVMSLEAFKKEITEYVSNQVDGAKTTIKNDFQKYVDSLTDNTIATANKASQDATKAVSTANSAVATANDATTVANSASTVANNAFNQRIGARNLLIDSTDHLSPNWIASYNENHANNGTFLGSRIYKTQKAWDGLRYDINDLINRSLLVVGETYTWSVYVKADSGITSTNYLYFYGATNFDNSPKITPSTTGDWTQISYTMTLKSAAIGSQKKIGFETNQSVNGGYVYFVAPKFEKGDKATDYVPAPEDLDLTNTQNQITQLTLQLAQSQMAQVAQANTNLNTLTSNGKWSFNNTTVSNAPGGAKTLTGILEVTNNGTSGVQTIVDTVADIMFWRTWNGSNFNKWHAVANDSSIISPA